MRIGTGTRRRMTGAASLLVALLSLASAPTWGREYHVAEYGSDDQPGTKTEPFRTIQHAAALMRTGDECVIHAGTYRETIRPANSGAEGQLLRFLAAPGETVTIAGTACVTGWSVHRAKIRGVAVDWPVDQVFADGKIMIPARFPNTGANPWKPSVIRFVPEADGLAVKELKETKDFWKGALVWGLNETRGWVASTAPVLSSQEGKIVLAKIPWHGGGAARGWLFGTLGALDAEGEWHQEQGALYFWPPAGGDPAKMRIEATRRRWAFDLSGLHHVELRGLRLFAASLNLDKAENCLVAGCRLLWPCVQRDIRGGWRREINAAVEGAGLVVGGAHNVVRDSVIAFSPGDGVTVFGAGNTVENCVIHDCDTSGSDCAPITCVGLGHVIRGNTLYNGGRSILVHRFLRKGRIEHNHIYNSGLLTNDQGVTYTYGFADGEGTVIAYNLVHHNFGRAPGNVGIYLDDGTRNHVVHHNLVYQVSEALALNPPNSQGNLILNNTLDGFNCSLGMASHRPQDLTGSRLINNIFTHRLPKEMPKMEVGKNLFCETDARFVNRPKADYQLALDSPAVDAGVEMPPYTDGFAGRAPDLGAFERGRAPWTAGSSLPHEQWEEDPDWAVGPGQRGPCYEAPPPAP